MTEAKPALLPVEQVDIDAAAKLANARGDEYLAAVLVSHPETAKHDLTVRAFAAHRLTTPAPTCKEPGEVEELIKPYANYHGDLPDYDDPLRCVYESGIQYAVELLATTLKVEDYEPCDGTEEFDGDLAGTLMNIICEALPKHPDGERMWPSEVADALSRPAASAENGLRDTFQARVQPWMLECFSEKIAADRTERGDRLLEEVFETLQSGGYDPDRIAPLREYVWSRPVGEPSQEVGGVMVTLAAYCLAHGIDMHETGETELTRILQPEIVEKIRAKQAAKAAAIPFPPLSATPSQNAENADGEGRESDWFNGDVDADGNELITVRKDEWDQFQALKNGPPYASDSWAENGYASPAEEINDMAEVGRSLMDRMAQVICSPGRFKGWSPMDDPSEIVTDMANWIDENAAQPKAGAVDREALRRALKHWHRDTCYPDASEGELDIGLDKILNLISGGERDG